MDGYRKGTFGYDLNYLSHRDTPILLRGNSGLAQVLVSPGYQGKVFTSTADGLSGRSLGYLNYKAFEAAIPDPHMNGYGGENRLWIGPEGGQFSIFFKSGEEQIYDNWHTPTAIDTEVWEVMAVSSSKVKLKKEMKVCNYKGKTLRLRIERKITLMESEEIAERFGLHAGAGIQAVGYDTENVLVNGDDFAWDENTGTVCIWMLDMFHPGDEAVTILPFRRGEGDKSEKIATTDYFGEIPSDRIKEKDGVLYLKTDGNYRSKLGLNGKHACPVAGNYNPQTGCLTLVTYEVDEQGIYLNQEWNPAKNPLVGDAVNAYNDGPLEDGSVMGPFLEIESASPAAFLKPGEKLIHRHSVCHFLGEEKNLNDVSEKCLGVSIEAIKKIFNH